MKKQKLQRRLLAYFALVAFLPVLTIMGYYIYTVQRNTKSSLDESYQQRILYATDKIENKVTQVNEFATWIFQNEQLHQLLSRAPEQLETYDETTHAAVQDILRQFSYRPITGDILSLFLLGRNGLDLRGGTDASLIDIQTVYPLLEEMDGCDQYWGILTDNLTDLTETPSVIFYRHPVANQEDGKVAGWLVLLFSSQVFYEDCADLLVSEQDVVTLYNKNGGVLAAYGDGGANSRLTYTNTSLSLGWTLEAKVDGSVLDNQTRAALQSALLTAALIFVLILLMAWYLSRNFTRPIERIMRQVAKISKGDFSHPSQPPVQTDEIGQLEMQITRMGDSIDRLMNEQLEREQEKRRMEVRILQNQMNPHFLYNTLNSIKLMAALQGKNSIQNMIEALGRLLRANLSISTEEVCLSEELSLLDSYIYIQNAAHKGKIKYDCRHVGGRERNCMVPKFLLQPLVENAIIHGLTPLPLGGTITLTAAIYGNSLHIRVADNGIGMPPETVAHLRTLFRAAELPQGKNAHGVGLWNTAHRLALQYGNLASLTVYSRMGRGTSVIIRLPVKGKEGKP